MSRRKNKRQKKNQKHNTGKSTNTSQKSAGSNETKTSSPVEKLKRVEAGAIDNATENDLVAAENVSIPDDGASAEDILKRATAALVLLEVQYKRTKSAETAAKDKEEKLETAIQDLKTERDSLDSEQTELLEKISEVDERVKKIDDDKNMLVEQQETLLLRELDADAGFVERNQEALAQLEQQAKDIRERFSSHRNKIATERDAWEEEIQGRRTAFDTESAAKRVETEASLEKLNSEITSESEAIKAGRKRLRKELQSLELDQELLKEDRDSLNEKIELLAARTIENKDGDIKALEERLSVARNDRDQLAQRLAEHEEAERLFGNKTPEEVLQQLKELQNDRDKLQKSLGGRPSAEAAQRLENLERERELWESDRLNMMAELAEAKQDSARRRIAVVEMESLRDEKTSLQSANMLLHEANRQIRTEVDALVKGAEGKSPFPSCSQMDSEDKLQQTRPTTDSITNLKTFADNIRHQMVLDPETEIELYYSARDVRSLLGGLAMSRLHLLHGISGTGKTSLPLAFARAIGAGSALVEVQAGWRDRLDLIGHFNSFEKRFYESEFLQALYKAECPFYQNTPFIVVLDEMNLSHPEQYFADLLSALEQKPSLRRLVLMTAAVEPAPKLLTEGGTKLPLPQNVWFIGTANHDETTKDFADKTYDRAHVMELPRNREVFTRKDIQPQNPVSIAALQQAFDDAKVEHGQEADQAYTFLENNLGEILGKRFRVGWGNRLERQMEDYVPVVIAAGGSIGEATDHILATKLLRKIRDRHDNRPEDLIVLRDHIKTEWKLLDRDTEPVRSVEILRQELQRLGSDDE